VKARLQGNSISARPENGADKVTHYRLSIDERMELIRSFAHEISTEEELQKLLANKPTPIAYDGFEPSGRMHIAQVRLCAGLGAPLRLIYDLNAYSLLNCTALQCRHGQQKLCLQEPLQAIAYSVQPLATESCRYAGGNEGSERQQARQVWRALQILVCSAATLHSCTMLLYGSLQPHCTAAWRSNVLQPPAATRIAVPQRSHVLQCSLEYSHCNAVQARLQCSAVACSAAQQRSRFIRGLVVQGGRLVRTAQQQDGWRPEEDQGGRGVHD
jgi:hypothetical protein